MPKATLMQHQVEGVKFLEDLNGIGALLWDPGVGKTGATLAWIDALAVRQREVRVLVVAPLTAADTWVLQPPLFMDSVVKARMMQGTVVNILTKIKESHDWTRVPDATIQTNHRGTTGNRVTILSMSAGAVSSFCDERVKTVKMLQAIRKYAPHVVVMDESHMIKAAFSNISKAMYQIGQLAPHRIILTGTVNPHDSLDCYGQWRFLAPWTFSDQADKPFVKNNPHRMTRMQAASIRPWPWGRFESLYGQKGGHKGKSIVGVNPLTITDLRNRVSQRSMVVRKEDALDLPPVSDIDIHVALSAAEEKAYNQMRDDLAAELADGSLIEAPNVLAKIMKLRQITAGFIRDTDTGEVHRVGYSKELATAEVTTTQLASEQRVVVFAYFRAECQALAERLAKMEKSTTVETITGATKANERLAIRQRFGDVSRNPNRTILVAQARTMSLSVNELVTAQNGLFASLSERRDDWVQGRGRLDRNGQKKPVTFWNLFVPNTVDQIMLDRHKDRGNLEKALLDHIRAVIR